MRLSPLAAFATFFFVQNLPRGLLLSVIPLQTYALLGDAQVTSLLLFAVSGGGILAALTLPLLIRRIGLFPAYLISCAAMLLSLALMMIGQVWVFTLGLFSHVFAVAAAEVTLSIYVLGRVPRAQITRFEPLRVFFNVSALTVGPFLGVYLESQVFHQLPFISSMLLMVIALAWFRALGLHHLVVDLDATAVVHDRNIRDARSRVASPVAIKLPQADSRVRPGLGRHHGRHQRQYTGR